MVRPIDSLYQHQRLELVRKIEQLLGQLNTDIAAIPVTQLTARKEELEAAMVELRQFTRMGDQWAFNAHRQLARLVLKLEYALQKAKVQQRIRRRVYTRGNSTLQFLAEDELGNKRRWNELLAVNPNVRYSSDLVDLDQVAIP